MSKPFQILLVFALTVAASPLFGQWPLNLEPCEVPGARPNTTEKVRCGTYEVFENRTTKTGRKIKLKIVVFSATGENKAPDPLFYIPGGPGSSATEDAPYIAQDWSKIRER